VNGTRWTLVVLALAGPAAASGQPEAGTDAARIRQLEAQRKRLDEERDKLNRQLHELTERLTRQDELADLRRAWRQAEAAYRKTEKTHPELVATQEIERKAREALDAARRSAGEADPTVKALKARRTAARRTERAKQNERRVVEQKLQGVRERIGRSPEVRRLWREYSRLSKAHDELRHNDPRLAAAHKAWQEAEQAYRKACEALPENKARHEARQAYEAALRAHDGLKDAEQKREQAQKAAHRKAQELLEADEEGAALMAEIKAIEEARRDAERLNYDLGRKIGQAWNEAANKDAKVQEAQKAWDDARHAHGEAHARVTAATRKARDEAREAYEKRLRAKMEADPEIASLRDRLKKLYERINDLDRRIGELRKD